VPSVRTWLQAARPLAQLNIALPLAVGEALAYRATGTIDWTMLVAAHVFGVLDQLFVVFANDVADEEGDRGNTTFNAFSGGSRVLVEGKLDRARLLGAARALAIAMLLLCGWLATAADRPFAVAGWLAAVGLLVAYSFAPLRLSYRGGGEIAQGLGLGVVLPVLGYYLQTGDLFSFPVAALAPLVLLGVAGNIVTALPDEPADRAVGKATLPVRLGPLRARKLALELLAIATLMAPLVVGHASAGHLAAVEAPALVALAVGLVGLSRADAENRAACRRFVIACGAASTLAMVGWIAALVLA
jgi:1,4-dihydroxy-2-naphthoate octaprenyltransferase